MTNIQTEEEKIQFLMKIRAVKAELRANNAGGFAYFLVTAHGVGQFSLLFYLYLLHLPCAGHDVQGDSFFPWAKGTVRGFLVERIYPTPLPICQAALPAVWVVRDPIAILATSINFIFTHSLFSTLGGFWCPTSFDVSLSQLSHKEALRERINGVLAGSTLMQGSQLRQLVRLQRLLVVETSDLGAARVEATLQTICDFLGQKFSSSHSELFTRSYNAAHTRLDLCFMALEIEGQRCFVWDKTRLEYMMFYFKYTFNIDVFPACEFAYEDTKICVCIVPFSGAHSIGHSIREKKDMILHFYRLRLLLLSQYEQILRTEKVTGERVLSMLREDDALRSDFLRMQEKEIAILEQYSPEEGITHSCHTAR